MKEFICIVCPRGCHLKVEGKDGVLNVEGNSCPRGKAHAINEYTCPKRVLTSTVAISGARISRLPVISSAEIPKDMISKCLEKIYEIQVKAPVHEGDIICSDICGTRCNIVSARDLDKINL